MSFALRPALLRVEYAIGLEVLGVVLTGQEVRAERRCRQPLQLLRVGENLQEEYCGELGELGEDCGLVVDRARCA
eukprot:1258239-Pyramimonas_sp.AAC.1